MKSTRRERGYARNNNKHCNITRLVYSHLAHIAAIGRENIKPSFPLTGNNSLVESMSAAMCMCSVFGTESRRVAVC